MFARKFREFVNLDAKNLGQDENVGGENHFRGDVTAYTHLLKWKENSLNKSRF